MLIRIFFFCLLAHAPLLAVGDDTATYNRINISVTASGDLANDRMVVKLTAQATNQSSEKAAREVNNDMQWALDKLEQFPTITSRTLHYRTFPSYREQEIVSWQVEQGLRLEATEMSLLAKLTGELQSRLNVADMQYEASPEKVLAKENDIIRSAIEAFEERALIVSNSLGARSYQIVSLRIDTQNRFQGVPRMASMARSKMDESISAAAVQAGNQTLTASVSGEIELTKPEG